MSVAPNSEPALSTAEMALAGPAGLEPGKRDLVAGRYQLLEHIADGGMGSVYLAQHTLSRKKLALKIVHPYLCKGRQGVERFRREVSAAAAIGHPGIVQVFDAGVDDDGGFFMAMELLEGESLGDRMRRDWPGTKTVIAIVDEMLEPLAKAHQRGFIHRDLKPDNIFLAIDDEGRQRVKLLDFGLAREVSKGGPTRTGITFGTPEYMSPEQAMSARKVKPPGDVWSVGVMIYELLSGDHPFVGETANAVMANAIKEPLPPLREAARHVPAPLAAFVERCLEKEPGDRPQTAGQMLEELRAVVAGLELDDTVPEAPTAPPAWDASDDDVQVSSDFPVPVSRRMPVRSAASTALTADRWSSASEPPPLSSTEARSLSTDLPRLVASSVFVAVLSVAAVALLLLVSRASQDDSGVARSVALREPAAASVPTTDEAANVAPSPALDDVDLAPQAMTPLAMTPLATTPLATTPLATTGSSEPESESLPEAGSGAARAHRARARPRTEQEPAPERLSEAEALVAAGECGGRTSCILLALQRGRLRSPRAKAMRIDAYVQSGNFRRAIPHMRSFVRRHRDHPASSRYREILRRAGD